MSTSGAAGRPEAGTEADKGREEQEITSVSDAEGSRWRATGRLRNCDDCDLPDRAAWVSKGGPGNLPDRLSRQPGHRCQIECDGTQGPRLARRTAYHLPSETVGQAKGVCVARRAGGRDGRQSLQTDGMRWWPTRCGGIAREMTRAAGLAGSDGRQAGSGRLLEAATRQKDPHSNLRGRRISTPTAAKARTGRPIGGSPAAVASRASPPVKAVGVVWLPGQSGRAREAMLYSCRVLAAGHWCKRPLLVTAGHGAWRQADQQRAANSSAQQQTQGGRVLVPVLMPVLYSVQQNSKSERVRDLAGSGHGQGWFHGWSRRTGLRHGQ